MSTVSNCMRTSADSSWGIEQIKKEIFINLQDAEVCTNKGTQSEMQDSCNGYKTASMQTYPNTLRNSDE